MKTYSEFMEGIDINTALSVVGAIPTIGIGGKFLYDKAKQRGEYLTKRSQEKKGKDGRFRDAIRKVYRNDPNNPDTK